MWPDVGGFGPAPLPIAVTSHGVVDTTVLVVAAVGTSSVDADPPPPWLHPFAPAIVGSTGGPISVAAVITAASAVGGS